MGAALAGLLEEIQSVNQSGYDTDIRIDEEMCTPERDGFTGVRQIAWHGDEIIVDHATERSGGDVMDVPDARTSTWERDDYLMEIAHRVDACEKLASFLPRTEV